MKALITLKKLLRDHRIMPKGRLFWVLKAEVRALTQGPYPKARLATKEEIATRSRKRKVTGPEKRK